MFEEVTLKQFNKWNKIVDSFSNADIYYTANYVKPLEQNGDGIAILIYYKDEHFEAINVVIKKDLAKYKLLKNSIEKDTYFDFSTPYGYGGFLFKEDYPKINKEKIYNKYINYCFKKNIVTEFTRFHPQLNNYNDMEDVIDIVELGPTITVATSNHEDSWLNYESKNRNVIRKAIRSNVKIKYGFSKKLINEFKDIYIYTMKRLGSEKYYLFSNEYFNSLYNDLRQNSIIFYASFNDEIISMAYVLFYKDKMHYHLSGSSVNYRELGSTNYLIDQIIKYASDNGYKTLHLGGGVGAKEDSLFKFKKGFSKDGFTNYKIGKTIFNNSKYQAINDEFDINRDYFPEYGD